MNKSILYFSPGLKSQSPMRISEKPVEITLPENNDQIFASRYDTVLPDKQTFIQILEETEV
jgi:hypothetical protein